MLTITKNRYIFCVCMNYLQTNDTSTWQIGIFVIRQKKRKRLSVSEAYAFRVLAHGFNRDIVFVYILCTT